MFWLQKSCHVPDTLREPDGRLIGTILLLVQAWHNAKIALITVTLYAPTAVAMLGAGWSSRHFKDRRWHCVVPLVIAAIAFMCAVRPARLLCLHETPSHALCSAACPLQTTCFVSYKL